MRFCEWLTDCMTKENMTCGMIAKKCHIAESAVRSHVKGQSFPKKGIFLKYIACFKTEIPMHVEKFHEYLLDEEVKYKDLFGEEE